jgi:hypothetical protein
MPAIALMTLAAMELSIKNLPSTYEEWKRIRRRTHRKMVTAFSRIGSRTP